VTSASPPPDQHFADRRLASIYDDLDGERDDLDLYEAILVELAASSVLDVGCGTGMLGARLAARGIEVIGVDPAAAMLDVARERSPLITWLVGDATTLPPFEVDAVTMTGNVAQVFITDSAWRETLIAVRRHLRPRGHLVFETRDPAQRAWERWDAADPVVLATSAGPVESEYTVTEVALPLVSFRSTCRFLDDRHDGLVLTSDSTLRFRERAEIERDLADAGFETVDVRDTPDRPGLEWVFIARVV
jgi:SAM-dependent methyltransferase